MKLWLSRVFTHSKVLLNVIRVCSESRLYLHTFCVFGKVIKMSKDNSVKPVNFEEETFEGSNSVKMDADDQLQSKTGLLSSSDSSQIRITDRDLKPENTEVPQKKMKKSYATWLLLIGLSEILGTAMLLFFACLSGVPNLHTSALTHFQSSLITGLTVYAAVVSFFHISGGHINPIVTLAAVIFKLVSLPTAAVYIVAQFIGALLGYGGLMILLPNDSLYKPNSNKNETHGLCATVPSVNVSVWQALLGEYIASAVLIYVCCTLWDKKNASNSASAATKISAVIFLLATVLGPISGCSMNPARSFAPALFTGIWKSHWIYWLGPISAAVVTSYFYKLAFEKFREPDQAES